MKRAFLAVALLLVCAGAQAQMLDSTGALKAYAAKALPRCPGGELTMQPITQAGPRNFNAYSVSIRSTDKYCGGQKFMLHSPTTNQILIGAVLPLADDTRPVNVRVAEEATRVLGKQVTATVSPFALPDGLKAATISRDTPYGPFAYYGYVDASQKFLIVGYQGNLRKDPAVSLREALQTATAAARKGSASSKVEILEFSDFQCPTCARAHDKIDPIIQKNLSKVNYGRIDLPLFEHHEWAIPAAMGARAIQKVAPSKYWAYVDYVFKNQESIGKQPFDKFLKDYAEDHDINWAQLNAFYSNPAKRKELLDIVSKAFSFGISATPTFIVNGQLMGFGPDGSFTVDAIRSAIGATTPAPAKKK